MRPRSSLLMRAVRALQGVAAFFAAVIVIGQVDALARVDYAAPGWQIELAKHALALAIAIGVALIVGRMVIESLRNMD